MPFLKSAEKTDLESVKTSLTFEKKFSNAAQCNWNVDLYVFLLTRMSNFKPFSKCASNISYPLRNLIAFKHNS